MRRSRCISWSQFHAPYPSGVDGWFLDPQGSTIEMRPTRIALPTFRLKTRVRFLALRRLQRHPNLGIFLKKYIKMRPISEDQRRPYGHYCSFGPQDIGLPIAGHRIYLAKDCRDNSHKHTLCHLNIRYLLE